MRTATLGLALIITALALSTAAPRSAIAATVQVDATNSGSSDIFSPATINITVGDTVQWNFTGDNPHTVTSTGSESFSSGNTPKFPGDPGYTYTFNNAGSFTYRCIIHSSMTGVVNVAAAPTATSVPPTATAEATDTPDATHTPGAPTETATPGTPTATATPNAAITAESASGTPIPVPATTDDTIAPSGTAAAAESLPRTGTAGPTTNHISMIAIITAGVGATLVLTAFRRKRHQR